MRALKIFTAFGLCAGLAACGDTATEQVLYGGGAGLAAALAVDGDPLLGAAAGAAANTLYCQNNPGKC